MVSSCFSHKSMTRLKRICKNKHSSLIFRNITGDEKSFYNVWTKKLKLISYGWTIPFLKLIAQSKQSIFLLLFLLFLLFLKPHLHIRFGGCVCVFMLLAYHSFYILHHILSPTPRLYLQNKKLNCKNSKFMQACTKLIQTNTNCILCFYVTICR